MTIKEYQTIWNEDKVIDLHNDLLCYLAASSSNSPYDEATRSSISQLKKGGVEFLALAVFAETCPKSHLQLGRQAATYKTLHEKYPEAFCHFHDRKKGRVATGFAIENCSTFLSEEEPLERGLRRLEKVFQAGIHPLYVSLTWNQENRCGGGAHSLAGLKEDGKRIIDCMSGQVKAIDLSHASDQLAYDILRYVDCTKSPLKVIASHSNFRAIENVPRNLPDELAQEIGRRGGVIGLTCIRKFIGKSPDDYYRHVEHALTLGLLEALAIGADFFCFPGLSREALQAFYIEHFFPEIADSGSLQSVLDNVGKRFGKEVQEKMAWKNAWEKILV